MVKLLTPILFVFMIFCNAEGATERENAYEKSKLLKSSKDYRLYTSCNLFSENGSVRAINYQVGSIIPAGTEIDKLEINEGPESYDGSGLGSGEELIKVFFRTTFDQKSYEIKFTEKYHPGKTIFSYVNMFFSNINVNDLYETMDQDVVKAIQRAAVIKGMKKSEVIFSYGFPAEHVTPNLQGDVWIYWKNRFKKKKICFDSDDRAMKCEKQRSDDL